MVVLEGDGQEYLALPIDEIAGTVPKCEAHILIISMTMRCAMRDANDASLGQLAADSFPYLRTIVNTHQAAPHTAHSSIALFTMALSLLL